jgi:anti-sigma regulatory factor (Ser/Thr protein kinase)
MEHRFKHRAVIQEVPDIRRSLTSLAVPWGISKPDIKQIIFIAEEIFSNIVRFAFHDQQEHEIEFVLIRDEEKIILEIIDDGIPFDPLQYRLSIPSNPAAMDSGGMGLSLVRTFSDTISYQRIGQMNHLMVTKWLKTRKDDDQF